MKSICLIKRDGRSMRFDIERLKKSINLCAMAISYEEFDYEFIANQILQSISKAQKQWNTEQIYQLVISQLNQLGYPNMAKAYQQYRQQRDIEREKNSALTKAINGLMQESNLEILNENANKDAKVIPTQRDLLAGIVAKHYAKRYLLPSSVVDAHEKGEIHYHDLDYAPFFPMFNCMLVDLQGMLSQGFKMGNAEIETPKSITTATAVTAQIIAQVASHIYGGTTINRIDEVLAPYVEKSYQKHLEIAHQWNIDDVESYAKALVEKECFDAFQSLEYEVNTLHTANGQTPFVTFGFGLGENWQARLIQQAILKNRIRGLGKKGKTPVFPKLVFTIKKGLNLELGDPNYDIKQLALECASKRMYPDILNYDQVVRVTGSFKAPMGCRSFLSAYYENSQLIHEGRNNLGVVSINLPRIALESGGQKSRFFSLLEERLQIAKQALLSRIERLENTQARVAPILYMEGACGVKLKAEDKIADIFRNGRASISLGYIGIHETLNALYPKLDQHIYENAELAQLGIEIVRYMSETVKKWQQETGYAFSLYGTPSENLCHRFCQLDQKQFGIIKGVTDKGYYTNSYHLDVEKKVNPYDKIDFEMPYPELSSGGFICYGEYPNLQHNLKALENVWDYSYTRVPYYGTNTPIDECYECDFSGEFDCTSKGFTCPNCGNHNSETVSVTRRVCGYLGSPDARPFNQGKQEEVKRRVKHL